MFRGFMGFSCLRLDIKVERWLVFSWNIVGKHSLELLEEGKPRRCRYLLPLLGVRMTSADAIFTYWIIVPTAAMLS